MAHIAYYRVSTTDQSTEAQRHAMLQTRGGLDADSRKARLARQQAQRLPL